MPSGKLRMKRTPAEEAERALRKARKAARKAAKKSEHHDDDDHPYYDSHSTSRKRRRTEDIFRTNGDESEDEYGPQPAPSDSTRRAHKPDYDQIQAELEDMRFRERLYEAMGEDERLDSVEASLNSYSHIPRRWRGGGMERMEDDLNIDPRHMEDEDYAEWVRAGMWRKKHAAEHEEQMRREAERKARLEREKALREETRRLEREAEEERRRRKSARERLRVVEARQAYDVRWKELLAPGGMAGAEGTLRFADVPWPVMPALASGSKHGERYVVTIEDLTAEAISAFLLPPAGVDDTETVKKDKKEKLRETMLRFHPDKFGGRIMRLVRASDKELVQEAVGTVARTLNTLMNGKKPMDVPDFV
ncbi:hypothetical protein BN946_scf184985.g70 [Trametes cinnabarina]|uniref:Uncharacterized protein n=1 Tax=Pycnoporus cinnabarinus TaxID=5643 RepID=A0A060SEJ7_PYCCI|nr:hypothetical protein BN946_scf184985.g70 [Trametes cinnabarina]